MSFVARDVKDRVVQYPHRYQLVEVSQGVYDLVPVPGNVIEPGTAINKAYLQPIEDGLAATVSKDLYDRQHPTPVVYSGNANNTIITVCTFDITKYKKIYAKANSAGLWEIVNNNSLIGLKNSSYDSDTRVYRVVLSSTPYTLVQDSSGNWGSLNITLVGTTATIKTNNNTGDYSVILY